MQENENRMFGFQMITFFKKKKSDLKLDFKNNNKR